MPTNIQSIRNLEVATGYNRDGWQDAVLDLRRTAGQRRSFADDLTATTVAPVNGTGTATVISTRATTLFAVAVDASGSGNSRCLRRER